MYKLYNCIWSKKIAKYCKFRNVWYYICLNTNLLMRRFVKVLPRIISPFRPLLNILASNPRWLAQQSLELLHLHCWIFYLVLLLSSAPGLHQKGEAVPQLPLLQGGQGLHHQLGPALPVLKQGCQNLYW